MRLRFIFQTFLTLLYVCALDATPVRGDSQAYRPGEVLVQFKTNRRAAALSDARRTHGMTVRRTLARGRVHQMALPASISVDQAVALYQEDPDVVIVEPNYYVQPQAAPDDPQFGLQWGLLNTGQPVSGYIGTPGTDIDAPKAWDITTGRPEVIVAVIDGGVAYDHPDLAAAIWTHPQEIPANGVDDDGNGRIDDVHGWDFVDDDNAPMDATGHGTHVAGIIAAESNNALGIAGVADGVRIMPLRFIDAFDRGAISDAIAAIDYALNQGARIINCSWGSNSYSAVLKSTMAAADALFVCAAGNMGADSDMMPFYPAGFDLPNVLSVAASDPTDHLVWFSNYGARSVHVAAPGVRIYSLKNDRRELWSDDFDDGNADGWRPEGDRPGWGVADPPYSPGTPALALNSGNGYAAGSDTWIVSPALDLSRAEAAQLSFAVIGSSEANADFLYLEVSTDLATWSNRTLQMDGDTVSGGLSVSVPSWISATADLGPWDGEPEVWIRLRFSSDADGESVGYHVDNFALTAAATGAQYQYMHGTSMATAFASGVAALVQSGNPDLTPARISEVIQKSVDLDYSLYGDVATSGRINAYNALTLLSDLSLTALTAEDGIHLSWSARTQLSASVTIQRRTEDQTTFQQVARVDAATDGFTDTGLTGGGIYVYRILAQTEDGRNGYSPQALVADDAAAQSSGSSGGGSGGCFIDILWHRD